MPPDRLLTIGEFSHLTRISVRMLRHYDEHGVLTPTRVDEWTGYRHYSPDLLRTAGRIRELRDLGLGVAELAAVAPLLDDQLALRRVLEGQRRRLEEQTERIAARLRDLDRLVEDLEGVRMSTTVTVRTVPARTTAALRSTIPAYTDESQLWQRLMDELPRSSAQVVDRPLRTATYHDESYVERDPDVEVAVDVTGEFPASGHLRCVRLPATKVASATVRGGYELVNGVLEDLGRWIGAEGYRMDGPPFVIYVVTPDQVPDPSGWVTEVCVPVERAAPERQLPAARIAP